MEKDIARCILVTPSENRKGKLTLLGRQRAEEIGELLASNQDLLPHNVVTEVHPLYAEMGLAVLHAAYEDLSSCIPAVLFQSELTFLSSKDDPEARENIIGMLDATDETVKSLGSLLAKSRMLHAETQRTLAGSFAEEIKEGFLWRGCVTLICAGADSHAHLVCAFEENPAYPRFEEGDVRILDVYPDGAIKFRTLRETLLELV